MDIRRAKEIYQSEQTVDVRYHGEPVWIDKVNTESETVAVRPLRTEEEARYVPVSEIHEK